MSKTVHAPTIDTAAQYRETVARTVEAFASLSSASTHVEQFCDSEKRSQATSIKDAMRDTLDHFGGRSKGL